MFFEHDDIAVLQWGMSVTQTIKEKEITPILDMIVAAVRKYVPKEYRILLFGSWAGSGATPTSDIDIAISGPEKVDFLIMARIRQDIEELATLRKLDIVDIHSVDEEFRKTILRDAVVIG